MYEGKNIHFSPLDNKPLCSYSAKVCKQRRLNGYSLCLRHVLEDPGAPFRQCLYQARNKQQCTNPIHKNNDAQFCTSHLQLLGLIPVGTKSCSKTVSREGRLVKNGVHNNSASCPDDQSKSKSRSCNDSTITIPDKQPQQQQQQQQKLTGNIDPYTFCDVDPPKTLESSPPLLSMVAEVSRLHSQHMLAMCTIAGAGAGGGCGARPASTAAQDLIRSIPISRLYPELVEKLESDQNRLQPKHPKLVCRNLRTASSGNLPNKNLQNKTKLKKSNSPSGSQADKLTACSLPAPVCPSVVSSSSTASGLMTAVDTSSSSELDSADKRKTLGKSNLEEPPSGSAVVSSSHAPWMLPMFEPQITNQTIPVIPTFSKTLHGLLNPLPLFKSPLRSHLSSGVLEPTGVSGGGHSVLFRSQSEPQGGCTPESSDIASPQKPQTVASLCSSSSMSQNLVSLDLGFIGSLESDSLAGKGMELQMNQRNCYLRPQLSSAASNVQQSSLSSSLRKQPGAVKCEDGGRRNISFVRSRSKARSSVDKEARRKIRRKCALKIYMKHAAQVTDNSNLLPTGVDSSEDDDVDFDLELPWQRLWNDLSSDEGDGDFDLAEDVTSNIRRTKLQLLKAKMRRQFTQLRRCHEGNACVRWRHRTAMDSLIASCRRSTEATVEALKLIRNIKSSSSRLSEVRLRRRPCLLKNDSDDVACNSTALPYTNHCLRHVMYNVDQLLFGYCTAKFPDKTQCCVPVFDVKHELPLCPEHIAKSASPESEEVKPKKQRKKKKVPTATLR